MLYIARAKLGGLSIELKRGCGEEIQERALPTPPEAEEGGNSLVTVKGRVWTLNILAFPHYPPWCQVQGTLGERELLPGRCGEY